MLPPLLIALQIPAAGAAQNAAAAPAAGVDAVAAYLSAVPFVIDVGCRKHAAALGIRGRYQPHRWIGVEAAIGAQLSLIREDRTDCGGLIPPPGPGTITTSTGYRGERTNGVFVPELRVIVTPVRNAGGSLRLIGGSAYYTGRGTPAWIAGAGVRFHTGSSSIVLDVERWSAGVPMETIRVTVDAAGNADVETIGRSRDWQGFWKYCLGFSVWIP